MQPDNCEEIHHEAINAHWPGHPYRELPTREEGDKSTVEKPIGPHDAMLAGHARSRELILVTNNLREFEQVEGCGWLTGLKSRCRLANRLSV